ncbi:zinc finger protein with KRAB and SCAN domains 1 [Striga asiatica]|uniref:Zinc finger protein with KRAB and SCAN domains 1 n=1 Tax=Striga asiatica TaxID=4170 RepID=A0A5A7PH55_STRAF|nr:zinc finger protein with KRAB and SCAN domains 1 [Striga asiatica]
MPNKVIYQLLGHQNLKTYVITWPSYPMMQIDALAAVLNGFLSIAGIHPSDNENGNGDSLQHGHGFTCRAPEFIEVENSNEDCLNYTQSSLDMASKFKNDEHDRDDFGELGI